MESAAGVMMEQFHLVRDCRVEMVVVYDRQAEVSRKVLANVQEGQNAIVLVGLSRHLLEESFR